MKKNQVYVYARKSNDRPMEMEMKMMLLRLPSPAIVHTEYGSANYQSFAAGRKV